MIYINPYMNYPIPTDYILRYDFNGDLIDKSPNELHGIGSGSYAFANGRKGLANECIQFTAGCVKTPAILPVFGNKVSYLFWYSTSQLSTSILLEMSSNMNNNNAFNCVLNNSNVQNTITASGRVISTLDLKRIDIQHNEVWHFVSVTFNRNKIGNERLKFYIDGVLVGNSSTNIASEIDNFVNNTLFIGARNASSLRYVGKMQELKIFNRELTAGEIKGIYLSSL